MVFLLSQSTIPATASATHAAASGVTAIDLLNSHAHIFVAGFLVTLLITPLVRMLAEAFGVVDLPDLVRKNHSQPVAYLGGLAVFVGLLTAIGVSYVSTGSMPSSFAPVPMAIVIGMVAITFTGLADDVWGWDPRLKIAGQLVAAAALAIENVGVKVAEGLLGPMFGGSQNLIFHLPTPMGDVTIDIIYWTGTALIAFFVLGGCNAANLIDGLDGLLSGVVAIVMVGLLAISLLMVPSLPEDALSSEVGTLAGARIVLCLGLLGAVLGFLPHNFKPASIFLGDSGSLLLGYICVVVILMLGENGQTHLVFAGLIVFAIPIIDTTLAIIRRKLAGTPLSAADDQHLHHQLKRWLGGVRRAVFTMYVLSFMFAVLGVTLAALVIKTNLRVRALYAIALALFGFVGVIAVKAARQQQRALVRQARSAPAPIRSQPEVADAAPSKPLATRAQ